MTLDEAIKRENKIAEENQKIVDTEIVFDDVSLSQLYCDDTEVIEEQLSNYRKCAEYHKQLAEWLEELVMLRLDSCMIHMPERLQLVENGYNKAIDDFVNQFNVIVDEKCGTDTNNYFRKIVKEVAEQLKESEAE